MIKQCYDADNIVFCLLSVFVLLMCTVLPSTESKIQSKHTCFRHNHFFRDFHNIITAFSFYFNSSYDYFMPIMAGYLSFNEFSSGVHARAQVPVWVILHVSKVYRNIVADWVWAVQVKGSCIIFFLFWHFVWRFQWLLLRSVRRFWASLRLNYLHDHF